LLHEVFPERDRVIKPSWQEDPATVDSGWPYVAAIIRRAAAAPDES
jgi:hypothetical protein